MNALENFNQHSDEVNAIILKKPKKIIRYGTLLILLTLLLFLIIIATIIPVTVLFDIDIKSKNNEEIIFKIEPVQAEKILSGNYQFFLVGDVRLSNNDDTQIKCAILSIKEFNDSLVVRAHLNKTHNIDNKIAYDNFKSLRIEGVPFSKLALSKIESINLLPLNQ